VPADTTRPPIVVSPRFQPAALYSASRGFGVGGGLGIENLGWAGSEIEVAARLSQRFQSASLYLYTQDPYTTPLYGLLGGYVRTSTRQRFYGLGPDSDRDARLNLDFTSAVVEGRLGWYPFGNTGFLLQPGARYLIDRLSGWEDADDDATTLPPPEDLAHLDRLTDSTRTGVSLGLEVSRDTRDRLVMTRRGALAEVSFHRFFATDDSDLRFNRAQARVFGFQPLIGERVVAFGRAVVAVTRADDGAELPFFYQPALDDALLSGYPGERFFGRDLFAAGAGVRFPFMDFFGRYGIDGVIVADVGGSYFDIAEQFTLSVSFDADEEVAEGEGVPLRPGAGIGFTLVNVDKDDDVANVLVGISPEGVTIAGFQVVYDFRDLLPLFR
jgi:outer membrane protein assembly factor BamA